MKIYSRSFSSPYRSNVPSELVLGETWDSAVVSAMIRSKCAFGESPSFLFLGRREAELLRIHLAKAFGEESVTTLHDTYYMGLEVITIDRESYISSGGRKTCRTLQDPISRRPAWRDRDSDALWQLRI